MKKQILFNHPKTMFSIDVMRDTIVGEGYILKETTFSVVDMDSIIAASLGCSAIICSNEIWSRVEIDAIKDHIKVMIKYGVGFDNIDVEYAALCGIPVYNIAGMNSSAVAEAALIHILNLLRKFKYALDVSYHEIRDPASLFGDQLDGKIVGLVGLGNIARNLVRMLKGFDVFILAYDSYVKKEVGEKIGVKMVEFMDDVFRQSDIVSLHIPLNKNTEGLIDKHFFEMMKEGSFFVNTCRGGVVNEKDLYDALVRGKPLAAGIDVVEDEPIKTSNPLLSLPNAFVTPHFAACSNQAEREVQVMLGKAAPCFFRGEQYGNIVNPSYINYKKNNSIT
jgi:D-3-phosphoglycerate dehydrogenase